MIDWHHSSVKLGQCNFLEMSKFQNVSPVCTALIYTIYSAFIRVWPDAFNL